MKKRLELRHILDIIEGSISALMLFGSIPVYLYFNKPWTPRTTLNLITIGFSQAFSAS